MLEGWQRVHMMQATAVASWPFNKGGIIVEAYALTCRQSE